jgi:hypothetical protein
MERRVTFFSPTLGITLHRGQDGFVSVLDVVAATANGTIQRQGDITVGDVLCEVQGIANLRNMPLTPQGWGRVVRHLKVARPLVLYFAAPDNKHNLRRRDDGISDSFVVEDEGIDHVSGGGVQSYGNNKMEYRRAIHSRGSPNNIIAPTDGSGRQRHTLSKDRVTGSDNADCNTSSRYDKASSSGNGSTFSSLGVAQYYLQMGTSCLIPSELRSTNPSPGSTVEKSGIQTNHVPGGDHSVQEARIEVRDMPQMLMVSQISMDEELMELEQQEVQLWEPRHEEYEYDVRPTGNDYRQQPKDDDPRKRGPQPIKPPRYNPRAVPKRRSTRRLSV